LICCNKLWDNDGGAAGGVFAVFLDIVGYQHPFSPRLTCVAIIQMVLFADPEVNILFDMIIRSRRLTAVMTLAVMAYGS
jgi:hypothetical protein